MINNLIQRAIVDTVTDIGQLSDADKRQLQRAVKRGLLCKGKGGPFPRLKTVYARPGFDFAADRRRMVQEMI